MWSVFVSALPQREEPEEPWGRLQEWMVAHLVEMGISQPRVLAAMAQVPRHRFVPDDVQELSYADRPLPIGEGQTISQPYVVARMAELLEIHSGARVLDVGTGSGYAAAIFSRIAARVVSIERLPTLAAQARQVLADLGYDNVEVIEGDGSRGYPPEAPYDAITAAAAAPEVPPPLLHQLADGGHLVMPVGPAFIQQLVRITRHGNEFHREVISDVAFVPLLGEYGTEER